MSRVALLFVLFGCCCANWHEAFQITDKIHDLLNDELDKHRAALDCGRELVMKDPNRSVKFAIQPDRFPLCRKITLIAYTFEKKTFRQFTESVMQWSTGLEELTLDSNGLSDEDFTHLAQVLTFHSKLTHFSYIRNGLSANAFLLEDIFRSNPNLQEVHIDWTHFNYQAVRNFASVLNSHQSLHTLDCWTDGVFIVEDKEATDKTNYLVQALFESIQSSKSLRHLSIDGVHMKTDTLPIFNNFLTYNRGLKSLSCKFCVIDAVTPLSSGLKLMNLEKLELSGTKMKDSISKSLFLALEKNKKLKHLDVGNIGMRKAGTEMADLIDNNKVLKYLEISDNFVSGQRAILVFNALGDNRVLESVEMDGIQCDIDGCVQALGDMFKKNKHLLSIVMDNFHPDGVELVNAMKGGIMANKQLKILSLSHMQLNEERAMALIGVLGSTVLQHFKFSWNSVNDEIMAVGSDLLATNTALATLDLTGNSLTIKGVSHLLHKMEGNEALQTLILTDNGMNGASIEVLTQFISKNTRLRHLFLRSMNWTFTPETVEALTSALGTNKNLLSLSFTYNSRDDEALGYEPALKIGALLLRNRNTFALPAPEDVVGETGLATVTKDQVKNMQDELEMLREQLAAMKREKAQAAGPTLPATNPTPATGADTSTKTSPPSKIATKPAEKAPADKKKHDEL